MENKKGWWWSMTPRIGCWIRCKDGKLHDIYDFDTEEELLAAMKYPKEYQTKEEYQKLCKVLRSKGVHDPYFGY